MIAEMLKARCVSLPRHAATTTPDEIALKRYPHNAKVHGAYINGPFIADRVRDGWVQEKGRRKYVMRKARG